MIAQSLRWRLMLGAAAAIVVALAAAWVFMTILFERHLERRLESEMERDGVRLAAALSLDAAGAPIIAEPPGDSRLQTPASGYYWQVSNANGSARSRSLWDADLPAAGGAGAESWRLRRAPGPFDQNVALLERMITPEPAGPAVLVQLAQDTAPLATARGEFGREMALFLTLLGLVLLGASWLQVALGLRPLARIRGALATMQASAAARLPDARLSEIQPLTQAINELAAARERDLGLARQRAADLAHGLKTPLAALTAQVRRRRESGAAAEDEGLERAIAAIRRAIDAELARARAAAMRAAPVGQVNVRTVIEQLVTVLEHTESGERLLFEVDAPADLHLGVEHDDLTEMLGAVLENAMRFARRQVRVAANADERGVSIVVEDDGPGIAREDQMNALARGGRLDEASVGSGLGLAIARELAEASGGSIELGRATLGGLSVRFNWNRRAP